MSLWVSPLAWMYWLTAAVAGASYACTRGPDGRVLLSFVLFGSIAVAYMGLAWLSRRDAVFSHFALHLLVYLVAAALGCAPKPRLDGMAGMLYLLIPAAVVIIVLLGSFVRLIARWI